MQMLNEEHSQSYVFNTMCFRIPLAKANDMVKLNVSGKYNVYRKSGQGQGATYY